MNRLKEFLASLSFRTGVIVLLCCVPAYVVAFAQMALPLSATVKGVLWVLFFGIAKLLQYTGLAILGAEGVKRLKRAVRNRKKSPKMA